MLAPMRATALLACATATLFALAGLAGCGRAPEPPPRAPTSWTAAESATAATKLMESAVRHQWISQWRARNQDRAPSLNFGPIEDRSNDRVPMAALRQAFADELARVGADRLVLAGEGKGTVELSGVVSMTPEPTADGVRRNRFFVDLRIAEAETKDPLWTGSIELLVADPRP